MDLYRAIGVKEYILVSQEGTVELYKLQNDNYRNYIKIDDIFKSDYFNISVSFEKVFNLVRNKFK